METLNKIYEKLINDRVFNKLYTARITKWLGIDVIRIERKELPLNERYDYNASFHVDYHQRMCFDIHCETSYLFFERIRCFALSCEIGFTPNKDDYNTVFVEDSRPCRISKNEYNKVITRGDSDIIEILSFISNEEWQILNDRANNSDVLASNDMRCPDCQKKLYYK
jgi:hypothetical protein